MYTFKKDSSSYAGLNQPSRPWLAEFTIPVASLPVVGLPVVPVVILLAVLLACAHTCGSARVVGSITDPVGTITSGSVRLVIEKVAPTWGEPGGDQVDET